MAVGIAEEEAVERSTVESFDHLGAVGDQPHLELREVFAREAQRDVGPV